MTIESVRPISAAMRESTGNTSGPVSLETTSAAPAEVKAGVLVVGAFADGALPAPASELDSASKGRLSALIERGDLESKAGATVLLHDPPGVAAQRVLVVSLGPREEFDDKAFRKALGGAAKTLASGKAADAAVTLAAIDVPGRSLAWRTRETARMLADGLYRFDAPKTNGAKTAERGAHKIVLASGNGVSEDIEAAVRRGAATAEGMALARDLGNLPANICNPEHFAETARRMAKELPVEVDVLEREDMAKLGMNAALSVGRASGNPCKLVVMHYRGGGNAKPIVLIGKGVTFDTGGISLKPGEDLDMMKYDMCGAASVYGVMQTIARLGLPLNLVVAVNAVENMPGGDATRPGDVVRSMSGQTIEILNTDAEGRLGLCDVLTYVERFEPDCVIDVATLTGACVIALGNVASGLFANDDALAEELLASAEASGDRAWRMPLWDEYQEQLKSNFADMSNLGGRPAGSVTAACFLARFAKNYRWAHLDIAGTNARSGDEKGATGRPVPLLAEFLMRRADASGSTVAQPGR